MRQATKRQRTEQMPVTAFANRAFVGLAVLGVGRLMLAILMAMMMALISRSCASEVDVQTMFALVAMVDGDAAARCAERVEVQPIARLRGDEPWRPIAQLSTRHPRTRERPT